MSTKAQAQRIINSERTSGQPVPFCLPPNRTEVLLYDGHQRLGGFTVYGAEHVMDAMVADRPIDRSGTQGTRCHVTHWRNGFGIGKRWVVGVLAIYKNGV